MDRDAVHAYLFNLHTAQTNLLQELNRNGTAPEKDPFLYDTLIKRVRMLDHYINTVIDQVFKLWEAQDRIEGDIQLLGLSLSLESWENEGGTTNGTV